MYQSGVIFYNGHRRIGRLMISRLCFKRMNEWNLTPEQLDEAFRYGRETDEGKIEYGEIGLFYARDYTRITRGNLDQERFVLITCWIKKIRKEVTE